LTPNEGVVSYQVSDVYAEFHQNRLKNCERESADRQTDRDDMGDFMICPMLCYSNGTGNKVFKRTAWKVQFYSVLL